jgi:DNA polymerase-3 subunit delta
MTSKTKSNKVFIVGSENFIETTLSKLLKDKDSDAVRYFYGDEFNKEEFFEYILSIPVFYEENIAVLKHSEAIKSKIRDEVIDGLCRIENNFIILTLQDDKPKETDYKKYKDHFELILEVGKTFNPQLVQEYFKEAGIVIGYDTAKYIYEMCNKNMMILRNEIEKVKIYYNYEKPKSDEDVIALISFSKSESLYQFIKSFFKKDLKNSLALLNVILNDGESVERIFYELSRNVVSLSLYIISPSLVTEYTYTIHNYKDYLSKWNIKDISVLIDLITEIDYFIKTGRETYLSGLYRIICVLQKDN